MKILLSNDDGIYATGINALFENLKDNHEVVMVAPHEERSTTGHGLSLTRPLRYNKLSNQKYSCRGLPADCVLLGVGHLLKDNLPDVVITGINHGANLGQDLYYSGTVAAAREAAFRKIKSIAVSQLLNSIEAPDYNRPAKLIKFLLEENILDLINEYYLLNINYPDLKEEDIKGIKYTTIGFQQYSDDLLIRKDHRNHDYFWVGGNYQGCKEVEGSDAFEANNGYITITLHDLLNKRDHSYEEFVKKGVIKINEIYNKNFK